MEQLFYQRQMTKVLPLKNILKYNTFKEIFMLYRHHFLILFGKQQF